MADITREELANLRRQWFGSVYEIADIDYQRQTWLAPPNRSPHWSYVEFCCSYPSADQLEFARKRGHLSAKEFELLASLDSELISHKAPGAMIMTITQYWRIQPGMLWSQRLN